MVWILWFFNNLIMRLIDKCIFVSYVEKLHILKQENCAGLIDLLLSFFWIAFSLHHSYAEPILDFWGS